MAPRSTWMMRCSTRSTVEATGVTATLAGSRSICSASSAIACGMVAENNSVCRSVGKLRDDLADVVDEAHVEHAVGFVEHEEFDLAEPQRVAADEIEQAPGRRDQDVDAVACSARTCRPIGTPPIASAALMRRWRP